MRKRNAVVYLILGMIPIVFVLILLATINILYFLIGIIVVLIALIILKRYQPALFSWMAHKPPTPAPPFSDTVPQPTKAYVILNEQSEYGTHRIEVNKDSFSVGRESDNDYVIDDPGFSRISRHHFRIEYDTKENCCYVIDTESSNGTSLNGNKMDVGRRYRLIQGDQIQVDNRMYVVEYAYH